MVGSGNINVMKIVGGTGADKNALIELIYFNILKDALAGRNNLLPFYINLSYYEKIDYDKNDDYAAQIKKIIIEDIKVFTSLIEKYSDKTPILFIDGIREFILSKTSIEHVLSEVVAKIPNLKKVVSLDIDFTSNKNRIKKYIPFAPSNFEYIVKVAAVDLLDEELCERYFAAFENLYGIKVSDLYEKLLKFPFYEVDSYILRLAANILSDRSDNDTFSISDLYETMCFEMFNGNNDLLLEAAKTAYEFDYNDINFDDAEVFSSLKWKLIKRHRSFVDFLISYYYVYKLKEFKGEEDLPFFEMILPRQVTRFVIPRLNESYSHEENIIKMMRGYYDKMNNLGKGALVYWLGRLKNIKLSTEAKTILQSLYEEIKKKIREKDARHEYHDENERKNDLFILRGISLSLLYNGYEKISDEYIVSLIEDDLANKINRGFHLEYYGDKPYIPNKDMLDFEDKLDVGEKALKRLIKNIENNFKKGVSSSILESELFNMCSLIQARINCEVKINFALSPYVKKCIDFLAQYKNMVKRTNNKKILSYFDMIFDDFQSFLNDTNINNINCEIYNLFSTSGDVKRAGWVELDIEDPESIVEHMYNTWLLGMLNLPPDYYDEEYDKTKILNMIIIHDLGERVTGDISYLFKINDPSHEENEDYIMRTFLLKGTYPGMINLDYYYKLWEEWFEEKTLNSRIAHDIDKIQAIYQFCIYYSKYPEKFTEERKALWLIEYKNLKTEVGLDIYKRIILNNKNFQFLK